MSNKWSRPEQPPPPKFFNEKERSLVKQINDELLEKTIGQTIIYYPISLEHSNHHPLYGETIKKTFLSPIKIQGILVEWEGNKTEITNYGIDRISTINVHFHSRRISEDQDLFVREGDFILYGEVLYEILQLNEPREIFGQNIHKVEVVAMCKSTRDGNFNAR